MLLPKLKSQWILSQHKISLAVTQYFSSSLGFSHKRFLDLLMALALISETISPWNAVDSLFSAWQASTDLIGYPEPQHHISTTKKTCKLHSEKQSVCFHKLSISNYFKQICKYSSFL